MTMPEPLPASARVVIIGGGVIGVSIAFHLVEAGVNDVLLLEAHALGSGSTCKAAGGVRAQFSDQVNIELGLRSLELFRSFAGRPGGQIDLKQVGYLFLLDDEATTAAFERNIALQNQLGVPSRLITPAEAAVLAPLISTTGLVAAAYSPSDGHCTPESVVLGYATAARKLGARLVTNTAVSGISLTGDTFDVRAGGQSVRTETIICAAGAWSAEIGGWAGTHLPVTPLRRQIVVTEPVRDLPAVLPMTIDFSTSLYFHREGPGLLIGMSDPQETPGFRLSRSDDWLPRLSEAMNRRAPQLTEYGIASGWAGLYEVTPDHNALIGETATAGRFLYATGFSGHGFLMAPAVGEVIRDLYLGQKPRVDVSPLDATRFRRSAARPELNIV
ncbi:MAG TPA: FAD-binding oxidoreductase [Streptosporangiaceae bacterium]